jgi:predicted acylesterase/phospholipase RssA
MQYIQLPDGIQHIALSFSGGGFRAAAHCLGCVSYLNKLPHKSGSMLHTVKFISSASGGSITALLLCSMLRQGKSFEEIYKHMLGQMEGTQLLDAVFEVLGNEQAWAEYPDKHKNLINAFAIVYDRKLFGGATFGSLLDTGAGATFIIDEIAVNATEFNNGMNFRFGSRGVIGNEYLYLAKNAAELPVVKKIKLADILACSSCFPAGFEPVVFPEDFSWKKGEQDELSWQQLAGVLKGNSPYDSNEALEFEVQKDLVSFMDGGIDDNQGIYAFLRADERTTKEYSYDLYLPCDVSSNYLEQSFKYPEKPVLPKSLNKTPEGLIGSFKTGIFIYAIAALAVCGAGIAIMLCTSWIKTGAVLLGLAGGMIAVPGLAYLAVKKFAGKIAGSFAAKGAAEERPGTWGLMLNKYGRHLLKIPLPDLIAMVQARAASVLLLADTVYLKKIRRISYDYLYTKKSITADSKQDKQAGAAEGAAAAQSWDGHIALTAIYLLAAKNDWMLQISLKKEPWDFDSAVVAEGNKMLLKEALQPGELLRGYINTAAAMDTTLWYDDYHLKNNAMKCLLIAGQATMCFNMLRIAYRIEDNSDGHTALKKKLIADWEQFKMKPDWMYELYETGK